MAKVRAARDKPSADQAPLPGMDFQKTLTFGGSLLKNSHARVARPLSSKKALHIVLRSDWATGERSLLKHELVIRNLILKQGRKHGVKVFCVANAGNHLHILVRFTKRRGLQNFLRSSCGLIARKMLGAERGKAKKMDTYLKPGRVDTRANDPSRTEKSRARYKNANAFESAALPADKPFIPEGQRFWSQRPFTRIVPYGKDFDSVLSYVKQNTLEALGFLNKSFTKALPSQAIRNRVLQEISLALENA